jgi:hypothetical protein
VHLVAPYGHSHMWAGICVPAACWAVRVEDDVQQRGCNHHSLSAPCLLLQMLECLIRSFKCSALCLSQLHLFVLLACALMEGLCTCIPFCRNQSPSVLPLQGSLQHVVRASEASLTSTAAAAPRLCWAMHPRPAAGVNSYRPSVCKVGQIPRTRHLCADATSRAVVRVRRVVRINQSMQTSCGSAHSASIRHVAAAGARCRDVPTRYTEGKP